MNCGVLIACPTDISGSAPASWEVPAFADCRAGGLTHQQGSRDHDDSRDRREDEKRRSPVIVRDEPCGERRHRHRRHPHAGRNQRHGKAALRLEPACHAGHHRREDRGGGAADDQAEDELELDERRGLAGERKASRQQHRPGEDDHARTVAVGQARPRPCWRRPARGSRWSWRWRRRSRTSRYPRKWA